MNERHILTLKHSSAFHFEHWYDAGDEGVRVVFDCPLNTPSNGSHHLSFVEALRQFALLTSDVEGWEVESQDGWHAFVESHSIDAPVSKDSVIEALQYVNDLRDDLEAEEPTIDQPEELLGHIEWVLLRFSTQPA